MSVIKGKCGTDCSRCSFKERFNCKGCSEQKGKLFWGMCDIYQCSSGKGHEHCGLCREMPCKELLEYIKNGHNPDRLNNLNQWKQEDC